MIFKETKRQLLVCILAGFLMLLYFLNCSPSSKNEMNQNAKTQITVEKLSDVPYSLGGASYQITNYKLVTPDGPIYFQIIPGCASICPAVVVSMPYNGITWSNDSNDLLWANNLPTGGLTADINGPSYVSGSGDKIAYYNNSIADTVGFGGIFLASGISSIVVYNRFYLGRKIDDYVNDFVQVVDFLPNFSFIDTDKVAFIGASLGGFVSMHASRKTIKKPKVLVGITPLLDLSSEYATMSSTASRVTSNPSLLQASQSFFNSYLRRMNDVNLSQYSSARLATENTLSEILVIHDTWDNVVPIDQWNAFRSQRNVDSFIFQHSTPIDYNSFLLGHSQASEGFTVTKVAPIYMSYVLSRLKPLAESKVIYYSSPEFFTAVNEVRLAQLRGQNVSWFKTFITDLCTANTTLKDYSAVSNFGVISGKLMAGGIIVNTWGQPTTITNGCSYLQAYPLIFN